MPCFVGVSIHLENWVCWKMHVRLERRNQQDARWTIIGGLNGFFKDWRDKNIISVKTWQVYGWLLWIRLKRKQAIATLYPRHLKAAASVTPTIYCRCTQHDIPYRLTWHGHLVLSQERWILLGPFNVEHKDDSSTRLPSRADEPLQNEGLWDQKSRGWHHTQNLH